VVSPPYHTLVAVISLAQAAWEHIEGDAAWNGIDPWGQSTLSEWCSFVIRWYRVRLEQYGKAEDRERLEYMLDQPNMKLHLYTLAQKRARAALTTGDSGFMSAMLEIGSARAGG
jgi:hypothetical protein